MAYMSEEGYKKLMAELKELETVERPKISAAIAEARDKGDLSENAEYDAAKEAQGMLEMRINKLKTVIADAKIIETGIIDIALRDVKGNTRKLTDLKGKVVLLDFSVFQSPAGAPHNMMLRELYNKYAKDGLEIYQVSLDADEHYWKTAAGNLPWVCVRDGNGVYSTNVAVYNVRQVPSIFLINRNNELKLRGEDIKDLEASVKSLL